MSENQPKSYLSEDKVSSAFDRAVLRRVYQYVKPYKGILALAFFFLLGSQLIPFFFPSILQTVIDGPLKTHDFSGVLVWAGIYFVLIIANSLMSFTSNLICQKTAFKIVHDLRKDLFEKTSEFVLRFFRFYICMFVNVSVKFFVRFFPLCL